MTESKPEYKKIDWMIWLQWVLATTLGWALGLAFLDLLELPGMGIAIGFAQWIVLWRAGYQVVWWTFATAAGWLLGWAISLALLQILPPESAMAAITPGMMFGLYVGITQWLILRSRFEHSTWWIWGNTVGWTLGLIGIFGGPPFVGAIAGVVTGFVLEWLIRKNS